MTIEKMKTMTKKVASMKKMIKTMTEMTIEITVRRAHVTPMKITMTMKMQIVKLNAAMTKQEKQK